MNVFFPISLTPESREDAPQYYDLTIIPHYRRMIKQVSFLILKKRVNKGHYGSTFSYQDQQTQQKHKNHEDHKPHFAVLNRVPPYLTY